MKKNSQNGFAVFLSVLIVGIILASVLGLSTILMGQQKTMKSFGHSIDAFYAAETGAEKAIFTALNALRNEDTFNYNEAGSLDNGADYEYFIYCCQHGDGNCELEEGDCPAKDGTNSMTDEDCEATMFCVYSTGSFRGVKRTIEVEIYP